MDQRGEVANPARGQLRRGGKINEFIFRRPVFIGHSIETSVELYGCLMLLLSLLLIHTFGVFTLVTEETTVTQRVIRRPIKIPIPLVVTNRDEVQEVTHVMVTTPCSNQQGSKSRQHPRQVQPPENIENLYCLEGYQLFRI